METDLTAYVPITEREICACDCNFTESNEHCAIRKSVFVSGVGCARISQISRTYLHKDGVELSFKQLLGAITIQILKDYIKEGDQNKVEMLW